MNRKEIYNPTSKETLSNRRTFGGNPDGMINFTRCKYLWATSLWDTMEGNTWFPKEVQMTQDAKDYMYLTEPEKRMYDLVLSQLIFMDSLQTNNLMDNINPYITAPEINAILSRQAYEEANHCLTEGHQVLTDEGFIDFKDLTYEHKVANWHKDSTITFEHPSEIIKNHYSGEVFEFKGSAYSLETTPNHRIINYNIRNKNKLEDTFAADIGLNNRNIPINGYCLDGKSNLSSEDTFRIIYQADGTLVNGKENSTKDGYCYRLSFKKKRKIKRLKRVLTNMKLNNTLIKHTITKTNDGYTHVYVWVKFKCDKDFSWVNISKVNFIWANNFIKELKHWDGCYATGTDAIRYGNTNKVAVDKIIELATITGKIVGIDTIDPKTSKKSRIGKNKLKYYNLYIRDANNKSGRAIKKTSKQYDGMIYCCTVNSGMIIVKRDDLVTVTGNSKSYAVMVESISDNTDEIYDMWKTDEKLMEKNKYIASIYHSLSGDITDEKIVLAMFANQILEGIYFYAGFAAMYALGKSGKMLGSSQMIKFIQRDEVTHLLLFQNLINSTRKERPELFTPELEAKVRDMFRKAVELEASWGAYITKGQILGFTDKIIEQYIQYLADRRLEAVGYKPEYNVSHPIPWVDGYASFNDQRANFFESNVINYSKGSISFDDF